MFLERFRGEVLSGSEVLDQHKIIVWDLDGTLIHTFEVACKLYKEEIRKRLGDVDLSYIRPSETRVHYGQLAAWGFRAGLDRHLADKIDEELWFTAKTYELAEPVKGAVEVVRKLNAMGKIQFAATSRPSTNGIIDATFQSINRLFPNMIDSVFIGSNSNSYADGGMRKALIAASFHGLSVEDYFGDTLKFLEAVRSNEACYSRHILLPYAKIPVPQEIYQSPHLNSRLFVMRTGTDDCPQDLSKLSDFLIEENI